MHLALCFEGVSTCHSFDPSVVYKKRREEERKGASAWGSLLCGPCCGVEGGRASPSQHAAPQPRSLPSDLLACYPAVRKLGPSQIPIPTKVPPRPPPTGPSQAETALHLRVASGSPETKGLTSGASVAPLVCSVMGTAPSWLPARVTLVRAWGQSALVWVHKAVVRSCCCLDQAERRPFRGVGGVCRSQMACCPSTSVVSL